MKTTLEKIAIMNAGTSGKTIEQKAIASGGMWVRVDNPSWNWDKNDYRVAPRGKYDIVKMIENGEYETIRFTKKVNENGNEFVSMPKYFRDSVLSLMSVGGNASFGIIGLNDIAKSILFDLKIQKEKSEINFKNSREM